MNLEEKVIKRDNKYRGSIINVEKQLVKLPNGKESTRDIVHHSKGVAALVLTNDNKMLIEKQWRAPVQAPTLEIPAGKVDARDHGNSKSAIIRELNEETRLHPNILKHITGFYSTPGFADEFLDLYLAKDLKDVNDKLPRDKGEYLDIRKYSLDEALDLVNKGIIQDAKTTMAIWYWKMMQK